MLLSYNAKRNKVVYLLSFTTFMLSVSFMLVIRQGKCVSAIKRVLFCYHKVSIFVFFHVFLCSLLLPCMLKSTALRVEVKALYNMPKMANMRHAAQMQPA